MVRTVFFTPSQYCYLQGALVLSDTRPCWKWPFTLDLRFAHWGAELLWMQLCSGVPEGLEAPNSGRCCLPASHRLWPPVCRAQEPGLGASLSLSWTSLCRWVWGVARRFSPRGICWALFNTALPSPIHSVTLFWWVLLLPPPSAQPVAWTILHCTQNAGFMKTNIVLMRRKKGGGTLTSRCLLPPFFFLSNKHKILNFLLLGVEALTSHCGMGLYHRENRWGINIQST